MAKRPKYLLAIATAFLTATLLGCSIHTSRNEEDGDKNRDVDIKTPFGSLSVRKGGGDIKDTGLATYPGARAMKEDDDEHTNSANVNISSSLFGVKVVVQKFESSASPEKVLGFYEKDMTKFGKVLRCKGGSTSVHGHHGKKGDPVTCDDSGHDYETQLKVGTEENQRIVSVKPAGKGSEFAVVFVRTHGGDKDDVI